MNISSKPRASDKLLGLMIITGFMLLLTSLPVGLALSLQERYQFHSDWHGAIMLGVAMTGATAIAGAILLCTAEFIVRRRRKTRA
jgi:NhaP-type Na+/H+ or K+/H+ antiporter